MKKGKIILAVVAGLLGAVLLTAGIALVVLRVRTASLADNYGYLLEDEAYREPVSAEGVRVIKQDVSCGYAVIEMFSAWSGGDLTEETLYGEYGSVVTSTGDSFCAEMNKRFPEYRTTACKWLRNSELLKLIHDNLSQGVPVPIEWAALSGEEWTLHYSLVTGMDLSAGRITVANPYGYWEELTVDDFLLRTSFEAYEGMPLFLKFGFAFGLFEKNTAFSVLPAEN